MMYAKQFLPRLGGLPVPLAMTICTIWAKEKN